MKYSAIMNYWELLPTSSESKGEKDSWDSESLALRKSLPTGICGLQGERKLQPIFSLG